LVSCLKRTMSRVLIIIVSLGYGVVKPRLGTTLNQNQVEGIRQKQLAALPLVLTEIAIFWWIFTSLINTMRSLRVRRNLIKLSVYRHFTNALCFAALISVLFMCWTIYIHDMQRCLVEWKDWVDTAFWHILFCLILVVIMILWRPSRNNQRYAFTPLLDDSEDENDEDELFNTNFYAMAGLNQRTVGAGASAEENSESNKKKKDSDQKIQAELKWIEDNIPSSFADRLLVDEEEDRERNELERSKML
uniref:Transmembrane protein 87A n=1 Tax=Gongylonema pulchrum TaxID=637853 RepID=A0A183CZ54_9BILA